MTVWPTNHWADVSLDVSACLSQSSDLRSALITPASLLSRLGLSPSRKRNPKVLQLLIVLWLCLHDGVFMTCLYGCVLHRWALTPRCLNRSRKKLVVNGGGRVESCSRSVIGAAASRFTLQFHAFCFSQLPVSRTVVATARCVMRHMLVGPVTLKYVWWPISCRQSWTRTQPPAGLLLLLLLQLYVGRWGQIWPAPHSEGFRRIQCAGPGSDHLRCFQDCILLDCSCRTRSNLCVLLRATSPVHHSDWFKVYPVI